MSMAKSPYLPHGLNAPIKMYGGPAELIQGDQSYAVECVLELRFSPRPHAHVAAQGNAGPLDLNETIDLHLPGDCERYTILPTLVHFGANAQTGISYELNGQITKCLPNEAMPAVECVRFHLLNFPDFSSPVSLSTGQRGPLTSTFGDWMLTIKDVGVSYDKRTEARRDRGYQVTHLGHLSRIDGQTISQADWADLEDFLYYSLSFCAGQRCPPMAVEGLGSNGATLWRDATLPRTDCARHHSHWLPRPHPNELHTLFGALWRRWTNEDQREATQRAFEWYWEAVDRSNTIETRLVLSQVALELLSWVIMVEESERLSMTGFKSLPAADRISLLANQLQVAPGLPVHFRELGNAARAYNWSSCPHAIAEIRNKIIHPEKKGRALVMALDWKVKYEATEWAVWLIELALLWLADYQGRYDSRVAEEGAGFPFVPWVTTLQSNTPSNLNHVEAEIK